MTDARSPYPFGAEMPGRVYRAGAGTAENYTGHELDQGTGLVYALARYYLPALGRFTSTDRSRRSTRG